MLSSLLVWLLVCRRVAAVLHSCFVVLLVWCVCCFVVVVLVWCVVVLWCCIVVWLFCCFVVSLFGWSVVLLCCRVAVLLSCGCACVRVLAC